MAAPTQRHLKQLVSEVLSVDLAGGPYVLDICDLTAYPSIPVAASISDPPAPLHLLVPQQAMENCLRESAPVAVRHISDGKRWSDLVQQCLVADPEASRVFRDAQSAAKIQKLTGCQALLVLSIPDLTPQVSYTNEPKRRTPPLPAFNDPEPTKPHEPDPDETRWPFGHVYKKGRDDKKFQEDWRRWRDVEMPEWERAHARWERRKAEGEEESDNHLVDWDWVAMATPKVNVAGFLRVVDASSQTTLWEADVTGTGTGTPRVTTMRIRVRGDDREPPRPSELDDCRDVGTWRECASAVGTDAMVSATRAAMVDALKSGLKALREVALWSGDLKPWNRAKRAVR